MIGTVILAKNGPCPETINRVGSSHDSATIQRWCCLVQGALTRKSYLYRPMHVSVMSRYVLQPTSCREAVRLSAWRSGSQRREHTMEMPDPTSEVGDGDLERLLVSARTVQRSATRCGAAAAHTRGQRRAPATGSGL